MLGAVGAAEHRSPRFVAVPDNAAAAMSAFGRERVDGAFEAIEVMGNSIHENFQRFVVFIPAHFAGVRSGMQLIGGIAREVRLQNSRRILVLVSFDHSYIFCAEV